MAGKVIMGEKILIMRNKKRMVIKWADNLIKWADYKLKWVVYFLGR
jgi:hypothetical protein